jgi:hypothetical protein
MAPRETLFSPSVRVFPKRIPERDHGEQQAIGPLLAAIEKLAMDSIQCGARSSANWEAESGFSLHGFASNSVAYDAKVSIYRPG